MPSSADITSWSCPKLSSQLRHALSSLSGVYTVSPRAECELGNPAVELDVFAGIRKPKAAREHMNPVFTDPLHCHAGLPFTRSNPLLIIRQFSLSNGTKQPAR